MAAVGDRMAENLSAPSQPWQVSSPVQAEYNPLGSWRKTNTLQSVNCIKMYKGNMRFSHLKRPKSGNLGLFPTSATRLT